MAEEVVRILALHYEVVTAYLYFGGKCADARLREFVYPLAEGREHCGVEGAELAVCHRANVHKKVRAEAAAHAVVADDVGKGFEVIIKAGEAPMVAEHLTHFACDILRRVAHIDGLRLAALKGDGVKLDMAERTSCVQAGVVDDHRIGLMLTDEGVECILLPICALFIPGAVKPKTANFAISGAKDLNACAQIFKVLFEIIFVAFLVPVNEGVIEERNYILGVAGIYKLADKITACKGVGSIVITDGRCIVKRKSLVMTGGEGDVLTARRLCGLDKLTCPIGVGVKALGEL